MYHQDRVHPSLPFRYIKIFKERSVQWALFFANHPDLLTPRAATLWASCLFAVDGLIIAGSDKSVNTARDIIFLAVFMLLIGLLLKFF